MLTQQLGELEKDGIIKRTVYHEVPQKVEYSFSEGGTTLAPILQLMANWSEAHRAKFGKE